MKLSCETRQLSKDDWLRSALEVLSRSGGEEPRIDSLVAEVGVSRGSFYWHFSNRADFHVKSENSAPITISSYWSVLTLSRLHMETGKSRQT